MKYMWSNNAQDSVNMQTRNDDFVVRTEHNLKMMESLQQTSPKKIKRFRSAFTTDQINYLEKQFKKFPYIGNAQRKEVAIALNIPERAVKIWFQNRRMKEKKEPFGKEFDDEQNNRKPLKFAKDQLNSGSPPSANDKKPYYSLPLLTDVNKGNGGRMIVTNNSPSSLSTGILIADSGFNTLESGTMPNFTYSRPVCAKPPPNLLPNNYMKSAEFSIDLCKKYKSKTSSSPNFLKPLSNMEDNKQTLEQNPNYKTMEQMSPEDLSSNRKMNVLTASQTQVPNIAPNNPGYISVITPVSPFCAQPYYTASGVLWKPVNMLATARPPGTSIPVSVSNGVGPMPTVLEDAPKKCCSCDCHVKSLVPNYNFQQPSQTPQYILTALQFPNPSTPKF